MFKKIVYQAYPLSFADGNNDGYGDLKGIISKLDYLQSLAIDILWINPIFVSPKKDNGYDIANYLAIDPSFGTMAEVEMLIKQAQKRNIDIMFDMVLNHSSTSHPWFQKALVGEKKYQDFYFFKNGAKDCPPTNWISKFGGSAWNWNETIQKWNLALFDKSQADLNWDNPQLRAEIYQIVQFWIEKGIKGFRFDVINLISKPEEFLDANLAIDDGRSFYTDGPKIHQYLQLLNKNTFGKYSQITTVGEMSSTKLEAALQYSSPKAKELEMVFIFHHLKIDYLNGNKWEHQNWDKKQFKSLLIKWQKAMTNNNGHMALFLNNHDQPRINTRLGDTKNHWFVSSTLFSSLNFFLVGTPFIYQGEEIGMTNPDFKTIKDYRDVESLNAYKALLAKGKTKQQALKILGHISRDNSRSPMQWSDETNAGFSQEKPWIKVNSNYKIVNVKSQVDDSKSVLNFYKKMIKLRKSSSALASNNIEFIDSNDDTFIFKRWFENEQLWCFFNLSNKEQEIGKYLVKNAVYDIVINNYHKQRISNWKLEPFELLILEKS